MRKIYVIFVWVRIEAEATGRMAIGETFLENDQKNPLIQRIDLSSPWRDDYVVEIEFTEAEFNKTNKFCREISSIVFCKFKLNGYHFNG